MATYVTSDIHGCMRSLDALLDHVSLGEKDELWVLGDLADRGDSSADVIRWAVDAGSNVHFLMGNHDLMLQAAVDETSGDFWPGIVGDWAYNGGLGTWDQLLQETTDEWRQEKLLPFLLGMGSTARVEAGGRAWQLVHAGFDPDRYGVVQDPVETGFVQVEDFGAQRKDDLLWIRNEWLFSPKPAPVATVHGHTPTYSWRRPAKVFGEAGLEVTGRRGEPLVVLNRVNVDCGCCWGGRLCLLRLDDQTYSLADARGRLRATDVPLSPLADDETTAGDESPADA